MSKDEIHSYAISTTPEEIHVPNTWPALAVWAVGKFGMGVVFLLMLCFVYLDSRDSNMAMVRVVSANAEAIHALASEIRSANEKLDRIERRP